MKFVWSYRQVSGIAMKFQFVNTLKADYKNRNSYLVL